MEDPGTVIKEVSKDVVGKTSVGIVVAELPQVLENPIHMAHKHITYLDSLAQCEEARLASREWRVRSTSNLFFTDMVEIK